MENTSIKKGKTYDFAVSVQSDACPLAPLPLQRAGSRALAAAGRVRPLIGGSVGGRRSGRIGRKSRQLIEGNQSPLRISGRNLVRGFHHRSFDDDVAGFGSRRNASGRKAVRHQIDARRMNGTLGRSSVAGHVLEESCLDVRLEGGSAAEVGRPFVVAGRRSDDAKGRNAAGVDLSHDADALPRFRLGFRPVLGRIWSLLLVRNI